MPATPAMRSPIGETRLSDGALLENSIFNQLRTYGDIAYLARGNEYEIDFILDTSSQRETIALEVKTHPLSADLRKLRRRAASHALKQAHLVGRYPTPGLTDFVWGAALLSS